MAEKLSVVIGIFEQPLGLITTLKELVFLGFAANSLCVCGSSDTVSLAADLMSGMAEMDPDLITLLRNTEAYPPAAPENLVIVGSRGSLMDSWRQSIEFSGQTSPNNGCYGSLGTWQHLTEKIYLGYLILMVQTTQTYQLTRASTLFLKRSADNVQTIECRPTDDGTAPVR